MKLPLKLPRLFALLILNLVLIGIIIAIAPQQFPVTLYKLSLVTLAGLVGYWLDRALFPYARPDSFVTYIDLIYGGSKKPAGKERRIAPNDILIFNASMLRRAIIVGCAMLAMGLGA